MYGPEGNSQFCFPESPDISLMFPETKSRENKTSQFPERPYAYIECFVIYLDFPLNNHIAEFDLRATTTQLYPGRYTFEFDQGHVTKNHPITALAHFAE